MERSDKILISALAALGMVALAVIFVLSLLRVPEWLQFVMALVLFVALGLGAYRYVITPSGRREESGSD
jgi:membrane protein implicated in regulation of membrane protease activity